MTKLTKQSLTPNYYTAHWSLKKVPSNKPKKQGFNFTQLTGSSIGEGESLPAKNPNHKGEIMTNRTLNNRSSGLHPIKKQKIVQNKIHIFVPQRFLLKGVIPAEAGTQVLFTGKCLQYFIHIFQQSFRENYGTKNGPTLPKATSLKDLGSCFRYDSWVPDQVEYDGPHRRDFQANANTIIIPRLGFFSLFLKT